ncbi:hypothetical protein D3C81_1839730 [compost metagenome]
MASGINAVDANVLQWAAPMLHIQSVVTNIALETKRRGHEHWLTDSTLSNSLQRRDGAYVMVQPVTGHE